jgi:SAM-dependent methyltransferase
MPNMPDAYHDDLAYIHDAGFGHLARSAAPVVLATVAERGLRRGLMVDLGCGSGILAAELSDAGFDVLGIDLSEPMLELARRRAPRADFRQGSLLTADIPPCVAVTAIGECFNYLFDDRNFPDALAVLLRGIHGALCSKGVLIFDVAEPGRIPAPGLVRSYTEGPDWAVLVTAEEDSDARLLTRRITTFRQLGELYRREHEVHRLRLVPRAETEDQLRAAGFQVRTLAGYGELPFGPGHVGFVASKS